MNNKLKGKLFSQYGLMGLFFLVSLFSFQTSFARSLGGDNGTPCSQNANCVSKNCVPGIEALKACAAVGKDCSIEIGGNAGSMNGETVTNTNNGIKFRCVAGTGLVRARELGEPCSIDANCGGSNKCRASHADVKYCVPNGKECGKSGSTSGFDIGQVTDIDGNPYICQGSDTSAKFVKVVKKENGVACTAAVECGSGNCANGGASSGTKFCAEKGNECGRLGHGTGFDLDDIFKKSGSEHSQDLWRCEQNGLRQLAKKEYNCPSTADLVPTGNFEGFPTKDKFKAARFSEVWIDKKIVRCYYGGKGDDRYGKLEVEHGAGDNCFPTATQNSRKVSCWK